MGAVEGFKFGCIETLYSETNTVDTEHFHPLKPAFGCRVGVGFGSDFCIFSQVGCEQLEKRCIVFRCNGRGGAAADKEGFYTGLARAETFKFEAKLIFESLHICCPGIEFVDVGVEAAVVAFGVTVGDVQVG